MGRFPDVLSGNPASNDSTVVQAALSGESCLVNWGPCCEGGSLSLMRYKCHFISFLNQVTMQEIHFACFERKHCGCFNIQICCNKECSWARIWNEMCPPVDAHLLELLHHYAEMFPHQQQGAGRNAVNLA